MSIDFGNTELTELTPRIAVIGVGGAGCNAVNNMIAAQLQGVDFIVANTDAQALANAEADNRIQLGVEITQGLGAGAQPKIGQAAAEEALERIDTMLHGCHMAFITAGMGGGTGTGAAPVIARRAREKGILTVGVVTKPFQFEGGRRMKIAEGGIGELASNVDTLIIIPNQNLFRVANERTTFADAFNMADEVLHSGVRGITDLMVMPGLINLDFADVRTVMSEMGKAMMGTGEAEGDTRASEAAAAAISNPLLEEASLKGAKGVIINVTGGMDMTLFEVDEAVNMVREQVDTDALIVFGSAFNQNLEGKLRVSVVATGIEGSGGAHLPIPEPVREEKPVAEEISISISMPADEASTEDQAGEDGAQTLEPTGDDLTLPAFGATEADDEVSSDLPPLEKSATADEPVAEPAPVQAEDELEQRAVEARSADLFVAEAPMMPKDATHEFDVTETESEARYAEDHVEREEVAEEPAPAEAPQQKKSLFQLMTSSLRNQDNDAGAALTPPPASNDAGADKREPQTPAQERQDSAPSALGGVTADDRPAAPQAKTEQLEIPSFLRRQQN